jgi:hypothetical protein
MNVSVAYVLVISDFKQNWMRQRDRLFKNWKKLKKRQKGS